MNNKYTKIPCTLHWTIHYVDLKQKQKGNFELEWARGSHKGQTDRIPCDDGFKVNYEANFEIPCTMFVHKDDQSIRAKQLKITLKRFVEKQLPKVYGKLTLDIGKYYQRQIEMQASNNGQQPQPIKEDIEMETGRSIAPVLNTTFNIEQVGKIEIGDVDQNDISYAGGTVDKMKTNIDDWDITENEFNAKEETSHHTKHSHSGKKKDKSKKKSKKNKDKDKDKENEDTKENEKPELEDKYYSSGEKLQTTENATPTENESKNREISKEENAIDAVDVQSNENDKNEDKKNTSETDADKSKKSDAENDADKKSSKSKKSDKKKDSENETDADKDKKSDKSGKKKKKKDKKKSKDKTEEKTDEKADEKGEKNTDEKVDENTEEKAKNENEEVDDDKNKAKSTDEKVESKSTDEKDDAKSTDEKDDTKSTEEKKAKKKKSKKSKSKKQKAGEEDSAAQEGDADTVAVDAVAAKDKEEKEAKERAVKLNEEEEEKEKEEKAKKAKKEKERKAKAEQEEKEKEEKERKAKAEQEEKEKEEKAEQERKAKEEQEQKEKEAKAEQERKEQEEKERKAKEEQEQKEKAEQERKAKEEQEQKEKEEQDRKEQEDKDQKEEEEEEKDSNLNLNTYSESASTSNSLVSSAAINAQTISDNPTPKQMIEAVTNKSWNVSNVDRYLTDNDQVPFPPCVFPFYATLLQTRSLFDYSETQEKANSATNNQRLLLIDYFVECFDDAPLCERCTPQQSMLTPLILVLLADSQKGTEFLKDNMQEYVLVDNSKYFRMKMDVFIEKSIDNFLNPILQKFEVLINRFITAKFEMDPLLNDFKHVFRSMENQLTFSKGINKMLTHLLLAKLEQRMIMKLISNPMRFMFTNAIVWNSFMSALLGDERIELNTLREVVFVLIMANGIADDPSLKNDIAPHIDPKVVLYIMKNYHPDIMLPQPIKVDNFVTHFFSCTKEEAFREIETERVPEVPLAVTLKTYKDDIKDGLDLDRWNSKSAVNEQIRKNYKWLLNFVNE